MKTDELQKFFEEEGFNVCLLKQDNKQCAEIEKYTTGGVDMIIFLYPFTKEEFIEYVNEFDIDEEIDLHRQDPKYKSVFTISQSVNDFIEYYNNLKEVVEKLENYI